MANKVNLQKVNVDGSNIKITQPKTVKPEPIKKAVLNSNLKVTSSKLSNKAEPQILNSKPQKSKQAYSGFLGKFSFGKKQKIGLGIGLIAVVIISAFVYLLATFVLIPGYRIYSAAQIVSNEVSLLVSELGNKDITNLDTRINLISTQFTEINLVIKEYEFLNNNDLTRGYYQNLVIVGNIANKGQKIVNTYLPEFKALLSAAGYTTGNSTANSESDTENNVSGIIKQIPKLLQIYQQAEPEIFDMINEFNKLNLEFIPKLGSGGMRSKIGSIQLATKDFASLSTQIKQALAMVPELLGTPDTTNYLIVFQNEKEMRASGGLLTAYGNLSITGGEVGDEITSVDMWDLEGFVSATLGIDTGKRNIYGQNYLMNFGCGSSYLRAQDSGMYPDLYWTMDNFKDYYDIANAYYPKKYVPYDNIIILNTFFVSDLVKLVEPITIESTGAVITSQNLAKEIFSETSTSGYDPATRKLYISEVAKALKKKLFELSPSDLLRLVEIGINTVQAKNIAFYSKDSTMQAYFDSLGLSGRVEKNFSGDYFQLNEAQNCSLKSNFYVTDAVKQTVKINDDKTISRTVNVKWQNDHIINDQDANIISTSLSFAYRAWIRVFTPPGTVITGNDGLSKSGYLYYPPKKYYDKVMDKQVSDAIIWFDQRRFSEQDSVKTQELNVSYDLPDTLNYSAEKGYSLLLQKHPGKTDEPYKISIEHNGVSTEINLNLNRDKVVNYKEGVITVQDFDNRLDVFKDLVIGLSNKQ